MSNSVQEGMSAVLYTRVYDRTIQLDNRSGENTSADELSAPWLTLVEPELKGEDALSVCSAGEVVVELADADETRALKVARLIRYGFQQNGLCRGGSRLVTSVVMFAAVGTPEVDFVHSAKQLVLNERTGTGNKILLQYRMGGDQPLH